jgi:hypothetical protein
MVRLNTSCANLEVKHFVYVPTSNCVIVTAKDKDHNRLKVYLVLTGENRAYQRNGINQTWEELDGFSESRIQQLVCEAFSDKRIPRYRTSTSALN